MLKVQDLYTSYGAIMALQGVSLDIIKGELVCIIGANGAGKTTLLKSIMGSVPIAHGQIYLEGQDITRLKTYRIAGLGISLVPEGRLLFNNLTVTENLIMGAYTSTPAEMKDGFSSVFELFPRLAERGKQRAGTLSGGEQQMLAIGRALMSAPRLLVLDEPSLGLAPRLVSDIFTAISDLNHKGLTILLVEQNANMAFSVASRGYVMGTGKILLAGSSDELRNNTMVKAAYLGGKRIDSTASRRDNPPGNLTDSQNSLD
jgi:branched-chain amino acid transport system ATP-binding protein